MQVFPERTLGQRLGHLEQDPGTLVALGIERGRPKFWLIPKSQIGVVQDHQIGRGGIVHHFLPFLDGFALSTVQA